MVGNWDFLGIRLSWGRGMSFELGVPGRLESLWVASVTAVLTLPRSLLTRAVSLSDSESSSSLLDSSFSELSAEFVPLVGVWLKCTVLLLWYLLRSKGLKVQCAHNIKWWDLVCNMGSSLYHSKGLAPYKMV